MVIHEVASVWGKFTTEVRHEMHYDELLEWMAYFEKRPFGWREDDRTYKIMASFGMKAKPEDVFESLRSLRAVREEEAGTGKMSMRNLKNSSMFRKMVSAKGGDKIDYDKDNDKSKGSQ